MSNNCDETKCSGDCSTCTGDGMTVTLTLQLKLTCDQYYPGLARNIYLKSLRYNLHLSPKALLIEAGAQTNTLQEILNTMEPLADVLGTGFGG